MAGEAAAVTVGQHHNSRAGASRRAGGLGDSGSAARSGVEGSSGCPGAQVIVIDPAAFIEDVKSQLAFKQGIPEDQQRLVFNAGLRGSCELPESFSGVSADCGALDLAAECKDWRAILFEDGKAIGQLCTPSLRTDVTTPVSSLFENQQLLSLLGIDITVHHLVYERWLPSWVTIKTATKPLYIPLDSKFFSSSYRIQVIGRLQGQTFALPSVFEASGKQLASGLSLHQQRADYVRRHQILRSSTGADLTAPNFPATHPGDATVLCGLGYERFAAVFDVEDRPEWLKRLVLPVVVAALKPTPVTAGVQWPLATGGATLISSGIENASEATQGSKQQPQRSSRTPFKKKPQRKKGKAAAAKARNHGSSISNVAPALQNTVTAEAGKSHPRIRNLKHKDKGNDPTMSVEAVNEMSHDQQDKTASSDKSSSGQTDKETEITPEMPPEEASPPGGEEGKPGILLSGKPCTADSAGNQASRNSASKSKGEGNSTRLPSDRSRSHGVPRNGDHHRGRVMLQGDARSRVLPHLQATMYTGAGDLMRAGSTDLAALALGDGWESPIALPRPGAISACSTPTSGPVKAPTSSTTFTEGTQDPPSREPSAEEVVLAAADALARSSQQSRPRRRGPRRRWSADLDRSDDGAEGQRVTEGENAHGRESGPGGGNQSAEHTVSVTHPPVEQAPENLVGQGMWAGQVGAATNTAGVQLCDAVASPEGPKETQLMPHQGDPLFSAGTNQISSGPPAIAPTSAVTIPSADVVDTSPDNASAGSSDDSYESSYPVSKNLQTDLERLLVQVVPMIHLPGQGLSTERKTVANMKLKAIWDWYEEPSLYGREVYTLGGARGASMSYYIPYISAIRLFSPVNPKDNTDHTGPVFHTDLDGRLSKMKLVYEFIETSPPKDRVPLFEKIETLYEMKGQTSGPSASGQWNNKLVWDLKYQDVHPHSWYAVSWYPIYRIPDAPLRAAFLTYHTLAPIAAALAPQKVHRRAESVASGESEPVTAQGPGSPDASERVSNTLLSLSVVGLEWYAMGEEAWCETKTSATENNPEARQADSAWKAHISELRGTAGRLARSLGARGGRTLHHDYNFFNLRS